MNLSLCCGYISQQTTTRGILLLSAALYDNRRLPPAALLDIMMDNDPTSTCSQCGNHSVSSRFTAAEGEDRLSPGQPASNNHRLFTGSDLRSRNNVHNQRRLLTQTPIHPVPGATMCEIGRLSDERGGRTLTQSHHAEGFLSSE